MPVSVGALLTIFRRRNIYTPPPGPVPTPGLAWWWEADDAKDSGGNTPSEDEAVASVLSGHGPNISEPDADQRPLYKTGLGVPSVFFDSVGKELTFDPIPMVLPVTYYGVYQLSDLGSFQSLLTRVASGDPPYPPACFMGNSRLNAFWGSGFLFDGTGPVPPTDTLFVARWRFYDGGAAVRLNNETEVTVVSAETVLGSWSKIGLNAFNQAPKGHNLFGLLVQGQVVSGGTDTAIMGYLNTKYGIS